MANAMKFRHVLGVSWSLGLVIRRESQPVCSAKEYLCPKLNIQFADCCIDDNATFCWQGHGELGGQGETRTLWHV